jgi:hypothetical protein
VDYTTASATPGASDAKTTGATPVVLLSAPAASTQRQIKYASIYNADSVAHTYIVAVLSGANTRKVVGMTLAVGQSVQYTPAAGWQFVPQENPTHQSVSATVTAQESFTAALLVKAGDVVSVSVGGSGWVATVVLQRMLDGATWNTVTLPTGQVGVTGPAELTYLVDETGYVRLGVATGGFTSGTIPVRLGVN